jgi:hypothetical protein
MGKRQMGFVNFRQNFLFPDDETYEEFATALMRRFNEDAMFLEQAYSDRGIEILQHSEFELHFDGEDDDEEA